MIGREFVAAVVATIVIGFGLSYIVGNFIAAVTVFLVWVGLIYWRDATLKRDHERLPD
jgi:hypothetical protein